MTSKLVAADLVGVTAWTPTASPSCTAGATTSCPRTRRTDAPLLRRLGVAGEFLLTVGTLEPRKNVDRLLQAYARARPPARALAAGHRGPDRVGAGT